MPAATSSFPGYEIEADVWEDRPWQTYFDFLLPNDEQKQTIQNSNICEQLEQRGDPLDQAREIDHWVYFPQPDQRAQFQLKVAEMAFQTRSVIDEPSRGAPVWTPNLSGGPAFVQRNRRSHIALVSLSTGTRGRVRRLGDGGPEAKLNELAELGCLVAGGCQLLETLFPETWTSQL